MADPKLKTVAPAGAPRRVLLNTGAVPTRRVTLKGADGRSIAPKSPVPAAAPTPAPAQEPVVAPEPAVDEAALLAQQEYERQMEEYNRQMEEYNRQMAEYEAQQKAEAEAAAAAEAEARAKAEAEAAAAAEAEARAKAEAEAAAAAAKEAEETATLVEAPTPIAVPKPVAGPKLSVAKPAGAKPAAGAPKLGIAKPAAAKPAAGAPKLGVAKPAAKPAPTAGTALPPGTPPPPAPIEEPAAEYEQEAPQMTDAEIEQQNAYYELLQAEANKTPFHKKPIFFVACGVLLVGAIAAILTVQSSEDAVAAIEAKRKAAASVLNRAIEINQKEVFTMEDAKAKGVNIKCSKQDAELLLHVIINHDERDENGLCWGPDTVGTAMNACVLLGIASEQSADICNMVFKTLADNATKMHPELLDELLDRLTKTNIKGLNKKLNALAKPLNPKDDASVLTVIWTYKERLATKKDVDKVLDIIKLKDVDADLNNAMRAYMLSLFKKMDKMEDRQAIGKQIWDIVKDDEDKLGTQNIMRMLAFSCTPEALEYYKGKMADTKNWKKYGYFIGNWQEDEIAAYINKELAPMCGDDEKLSNTVDSMLMKVLTQDRPRSVEDAKALLDLAYDDFWTDTSGMQDALIKLDENPDDATLQAEYDKLDRVFRQKEKVIKNLANCKEYHDWIDAILNDIEAECNKTHNSQRHNKLAAQVERVRNEIKENELKNAASTAKHAKRMELED